MILYAVVRPFVIGLCRVLFRVRVRGLENIPPAGAYVLAPTHRSILDTPFLGFVTRRRIRFMAKKEIFATAFGDKLFRALGGIPVDRGSVLARSAVVACEAVLAAGEPTAVFPEGTRRHGAEITDLFDGASYLAVKLGVPLVPVGIGGSEEILAKGKVIPRLRRVAVVVGPAILPPPGVTTRQRSEIHGLTEHLRGELQRLFDEACAIAAG